MLTEDTLRSQLVESLALPLVECQHESFGGCEVADSEAFAFVYVGFKERYRGSAHFLINSLRLGGWPLTSAAENDDLFLPFQGFLFRPLFVYDFLERMHYLPFWTFRPRGSIPNDEPINVVLLEDEWNNKSALAEYPMHFLYVVWGTGG